MTNISQGIVAASGSESFSSVMVILGFTVIGISFLTVCVGYLQRQAAANMDDNPLEDSLQSDYVANFKKYFKKSANSNVYYYFAIGEGVLGVVLLLVGWLALAFK